jgi:hypothetical protein
MGAKETITQIYVGYYDRAPDPDGLNYWIGRLNAGMTVAEIAQSFSVQPESTAKYPYLVNPLVVSAESFIVSIYQNLFNRAPDDAGKAHWLAELAGGKAVGQMIIDIISGATDSAAGNDATTMANKVAVGVDWAEDTALLSGFDYENNAAAKANAASVLDSVDDTDASVTAAKAATDTFVAGGSTEFKLTNDVDVATANIFVANRVYDPEGDDQMNSLQDDDVLTGTGTNPTLNFSFVTDTQTGDYDVSPTLNGIETVNVAASHSGAVLLDLQDATGVKAVNITRMDNDVTIDNIQAPLADMSVSKSNETNNSASFLFDDAALAGTADEGNVKLNDAELVSLVVQERGTADQGYETLNVMSNGSANSVGTLWAEDLKTLKITGDKDLKLGAEGNVLNGTTTEATSYTMGLGNVAGSLQTVDATGLDGSLNFVIANELNATLDNTSGVAVQLDVKGGTKDDKFVIASGSSIDGAASNTDKIDGGDGTDTLVHLGGAAAAIVAPTAGANLTSVEALEIRTGHDDAGAIAEVADVVTVDADAFDSLASIFVRNEGNGTHTVTGIANSSKVEAMTVNLNDLTVDQAKAITIAHGTTGNNGLAQNLLAVDLKSDAGTSDLTEITIVDGTNNNPRFNFNLDADNIESVTLHDNDSESNTVDLNDVGDHLGTITVDGGSAGTFFNLDSLANSNRKDTTGGTTDGSGIQEVGAGGAERITASTFTSTSASDIIARFSDAGLAAGGFTATGGQSITTGAGNDFIIFDQISAAGNQTTAGLTISDTVNTGAGTDTLGIDGNGVLVNLSASEWTNVSNVENIQLIGNGMGAGAAGALGTNSYNLTLTNDLITSNGVASGSGRVINIINDNDTANGVGTADTVGTAIEAGVTIDARGLDATHNFTYNGEEGATRTNDRFIMSDANVNGMAVIDGGAVLGGGNTTSNLTNGDILEIRNSSVVTVGDLAGVQNVGSIEFTNDTAAVQNNVLQLNNTIVDAMVNSTRGAATGFVETLNVTAIDNPLLPAATTGLNLDASGVTNAFLSLNVTGAGGADTLVGGSGDDTLVGAAGNDTITGGAGADSITGGTGVDLLTGGTGADSFTFATGDTGITLATADVIADFTTADDVINTSLAAGEVTIVDGSALANEAAFLAAAGASFAVGGTVDNSYMAWNAVGSGNGWLLIDEDDSGTVNAGDTFVVLTGVNTAPEFVLADIA